LSIGGLRRRRFVTVRADDESPLVVPEAQSAIHLRDQRTASHRRDVRQQSRSFARWNQSLKYSPKLQPCFIETVGDYFPHAFQIGLKSYMRLSEPLLESCRFASSDCPAVFKKPFGGLNVG
jgi:hypothetical protein